MACPFRRVEGIRPDQNPADDPLDVVKAGAPNLVGLFYLTRLVSAVTSEVSASSTRVVTRPFLDVDASRGELYSVENPDPHERYER
jgi:hypothetical protein